MDEKALEKFDPTTETLTQMVANTACIREVDITDKAQLEVVHNARIELKKTRVQIEKKGKELRDDANKFSKAVIAKEKELIAIIEPEEDRLKTIEEEAEALVVRKEREERLPARILRLRDIGDGVEVADDFLLSLDSTAFEGYFNDRVAKKNEADRLKADADRRANEAEASRLQAEKDAREREDKAREEERTKAAEDARRAEEERVAKAKREAEEAAKKEADRIAAEKEEAAKLAKREEYRKWRVECGWTEATKGDFKEEKTEVAVVLWKKVGTFTL
jgi:hypothetical protein